MNDEGVVGMEDPGGVYRHHQDPRASIIDREMTQVVDGDLVKVRVGTTMSGVTPANWYARPSVWPKSFLSNPHYPANKGRLGEC